MGKEAASRRGARGRPTGDTSDRILAAARDAIARNGVDALRLTMISARLGISAPAIYAHFPGGRQELIRRIALEGVHAMMAFFPRGEAGPLHDLLQGVSGLVRFYAENRAFLRIMLLDFASPDGHPSVTREIGKPGPFEDGPFSAMYARLEAILQSLGDREEGRMAPAGVLLNVILGATALNLIYPPKDPGGDPTATVEQIVRDLVCRYLDIPPTAAAEALA